MKDDQKAYIAGIIDSEGSISMIFSKRGNITIRQYRMTVKTTDVILVPLLS